MRLEESVAMRLEDETTEALDWFKEIRMEANPKKFRVILLALEESYHEFLLEIESKIIKVPRPVILSFSNLDCAKILLRDVHNRNQTASSLFLPWSAKIL